MRHSGTKVNAIALGLLALVFSTLTIFINMNDYSMHLDEVDLVELAVSFNPFDFSTYTDDLIEFGHPPLWYAMMSGWIPLVGQTDFALRVSSVLLGILTVAFVFRIGADLSKDAFGGLATASVFASMGFAIYLIHQTHNYALFLLATAMLLFFYIRWRTQPNNKWYAFGVVFTITVLLYTHYYGIYPVFALNIHALFLIKNHFKTYKKWFFLQVLSTLIFLPWLPSFYKLTQAKTSALVAVPSTWDAINGEMVVLFFHRPWIHGIAIAIGFLMLIWHTTTQRRKYLQIVWLLTIFLLISLLGAVAVNKFVMTFFDRRMVFWLIGVAVLSGFAISLIPHRVKWVVLIIILSLSVSTPQKGVRGNWHIRQTVEFLADHVQPDDAVFYQTSIISTEWLPRPFRYYSEQLLDWRNPFLIQNLYNLGDEGSQKYFVEAIFSNFIWTRDRFWVVQTAPDNPVPETTTLEWISRINGRSFELTQQYEIPLFIVSLFTANPDTIQQLSNDGFVYEMLLPQTFDNRIQLLDYRVNKTNIQAGESLIIQSHWQSLECINQDYAIGFHLIDDKSVIHAQWDGNPSHLNRPTSTNAWIPYKMIYSTAEVIVEEHVPTGLYKLIVVLYDRENLSRLHVEPFGQTEFVLAEINVE